MGAKSSPRSLVALLAAGMTFVAVGAFAGQGNVPLPDTDNGFVAMGTNLALPAVTTTALGESSDVSVSMELTSHPAHQVCTDILMSTGNLAAGCPLSAVVTVKNDGTAPATNVQVTAPQPAGWVDPVVVHPQTGCTLSNGADGDLVCDLGMLEPGATEQIIVNGMTSPSASQTVISSVVRVSADGIDLNPDTSVDAGILQIVPQADLSITYIPSGGALRPGDRATWTAIVTNRGPSTAENVRIYQALANYLDAAFDEVTISAEVARDTSGSAFELGDAVTAPPPPAEVSSCRGFDQNTATARCRVTFLDPGDTATMVVSGIISSDIAEANQLIQASVGVSSDTADPNNGNNNADISIRTHDPVANLMVGTSGPSGVALGERATWIMTVEDGGPSDAPNVRLDLDIPASLLDVMVSSDHGPCDLTGCDLGLLYASVEPDMPGNTADISITGTVSGMASGTFYLGGSVVSDVQYPHVDPVTTSYSITVDPEALPGNLGDAEPQADIQLNNLSITPVETNYTGPGSERRVQFTVYNAGPDAAYLPWFRISRAIDAEAHLTDDMLSRCQTTPREIMCSVTDQDYLQAGEAVDVDYTITLTSLGRAGTYTTYGLAYSQTADPDETNNSNQVEVPVGPAATALAISVVPYDSTPNPGSPADLDSLANPSGDQSFIAGSNFSYQITVSVPQAGLADASGVVVTANLPAGFNAHSAISASGLCSIAGQNVTCKFPTISAVSLDSSSRIIINGTVDPTVSELYQTNKEWIEKVPFTVTATSTTPDIYGQDVTATDSCEVDIIYEADLQLFVTPDQAATPGSNKVGYTLTVLNAGPSSIGNVSATVVVPDGYELDVQNSTCFTPSNEVVDPNHDGHYELVPIAKGFDPRQGSSVICEAGAKDSQGTATGNLTAGQAGTARIVLQKVPGASNYATDVEFSAGSLATDPDWSNNFVDAPLDPTNTETISGTSDTDTDSDTVIGSSASTQTSGTPSTAIPAPTVAPAMDATTDPNATGPVDVVTGDASAAPDSSTTLITATSDPQEPVDPVPPAAAAATVNLVEALSNTVNAGNSHGTWECYHYPDQCGTALLGSLDIETDLPDQ
ncbi:MAG: DUF11 domain-containing protein [Promicromonosporaceae bacterium]|nr:DUF11 domain-containing protein [Promicromonosporaceae bacterium]